MEALPDPPETILTLRYVADCLSLCDMYKTQPWSEKIYIRLLPQMKEVWGPEDNLTTDTLLRLANYYVSWPVKNNRRNSVRTVSEEGEEMTPSDSDIAKWTAREDIMLWGLRELERRHGVNDTNVYIYVRDLANQYWSEGQIVEAERLFRHAVEGLIGVAGRGDPGTEQAAKDFFEFYVAQDQTEAAEKVGQQAINQDSVIVTSRSTDSDAYWPWYERAETLQGKLAKLNSPDSHFYWEDSRIYLCSELQISLLQVFPEDPFPSHPIRIRIQNNALVVDRLQDTRTFNVESDQQPVFSSASNLAQRYQILHFLERKGNEQNWDIFGHDERIVRYMTDVPGSRKIQVEKMNGQPSIDDLNLTIPIELHSFMIFLEEHETQQIVKVGCHSQIRTFGFSNRDLHRMIKMVQHLAIFYLNHTHPG
jgi:hypothetical protein